MSEGRSKRLEIRTPEGIVFSLLLAGPVARFVAWLVDLGCIAVLAIQAGLWLRLLGVISPDLARAITVLAYFFISIGYGIVTEWCWRGQTVGKRLMRLRVMDAHGMRLQFSQVVIPNLLRFVDMLPGLYLVAGVACVLSKKAQRLGDFAVNTIVVGNPKTKEPDLSQLLAGKYNSLRDHPHLAARFACGGANRVAGLAAAEFVGRPRAR